MNAKVAQLLHRLSSFAVATVAFAGSQRAEAALGPKPEPSTDGNTFLQQESTSSIPKLVFGIARKGAPTLLAHSSHSSHRSHSSHSSHSSHYSGSSGGSSYPSYTPPAAPPPAPAPSPRPPSYSAPAPAPTPPKPEPAKPSDAVLEKLPLLKSKWPREVTLLKKTYFNFYTNGRMAGIFGVDPDTVVSLVTVKKEHIVVKVSASESPVPFEYTDIVKRMGGEAAILAMADEPEEPLVEATQEAKKTTP